MQTGSPETETGVKTGSEPLSVPYFGLKRTESESVSECSEGGQGSGEDWIVPVGPNVLKLTSHGWEGAGLRPRLLEF